MRLELNVQALERLIGGDTEIEAHLRNQIVQEFAKKKLKSIIGSEELRLTLDAYAVELKNTVKENIGLTIKDRWSQVEGDFFPLIKSRIEKLVDNSVRDAIQRAIAETVEKYSASYIREIENKIARAVDADIAKRVKDAIAEKLKAVSDSLK